MSRKKNRRPAPAASGPNAALPSTSASNALSITNQYDIARNGRRMASWHAPSSGPNRATAGLQTMRNRSRDAVRNEPAAAATVRNYVVDMVGTGIIPRPRTKKKALKEKLSGLWEDWCKVSDADGVLNFYGQEELAVRTWKEAGEVFARLRPRYINDGLPVPLQIQLIEPELCPVFDRDLPNGNRIRQGIEIDRLGRRLNYWMYKEHPGDGSMGVVFNDLQPIPASEILHIFKPKRPGQLRGVPEMASTLAKMKVMGDMDDAALERARIQNLYVAVIKRPDPGGDPDIDATTGQVITRAANGAPMVSLEPGATLELEPGEEMNFSNPQVGGAGYGEFMRHQGLSVAGGNGLPYEIVSGDIANVSDRTLRVVIQQYRRHVEQEQWLVIIPMLCQKVRDAWVDAAVLAGVLSVREAAEARLVDWAPQAWAYIHPVQDVQAKKIEIETGITSRSAVISSRGDDPDQVDDERAADQQREHELRITQAPPSPAQQAADRAAQQQRENDVTNAQVSLLNAQASAAEATRAGETRRAEAFERTQAAQAQLAEAEARYRAALLTQAEADTELAQARRDEIAAGIDRQNAEAELTRALEANESEATIAETRARAEAAQAESRHRIAALEAAETHAQAIRAQVLEQEAARTATARLELEAAQLGLQELQG